MRPAHGIMQKAKLPILSSLFFFCLVCVLPHLLEAQPRKRKVIVDPTPTSSPAASKPISAAKATKQKPQELIKTPSQLLNAAIAQYRSENYAIAESLLVRYVALSAEEPLSGRELSQLMLAKTRFKLGQRAEAKALLEARVNFTSEPTRLEADFNAAVIDFYEGAYFSAAKGFLRLAGSNWSPSVESALRRKAAMHLSLLATAFLSPSEITLLLQAAESPYLRALLLDALTCRTLANASPSDSLVRLYADFEARFASLLSPAYRTLIETQRQQLTLRRTAGARRLKVAVLLPLTLDVFNGTDLPSFGEAMLFGALQAVSAYHQLATTAYLDLLIEPCNTDDSLSLRAMLENLIDRRGAQVMLGPAYSAQAVKVSQICAAKGIPMLTPTATDENITRGIPTSFQLNPTYAVRGKVIAEYLMQTLGAKTFGVLAQDSTYGKQMAEGFREAVQAAGGELKFYGILPSSMKGIAQALAPLKLKADPKKGFPETYIDAVYVPLSNFEAIAIAVEQSKFYNIKTRIIGSGDWHDPVLLSQYRQIGDSVIYAIDSHVSPDRPETQRVANVFKDRWGTAPTLPFWFGYDAMDFLIAATVEKGIVETSLLANAIRNAPLYHGHRNDIFFGGGNVNLRMNIMKFQNGTLTQLQ